MALKRLVTVASPTTSLACVLNNIEGPTKIVIRKDTEMLSNLMIESLDKKEHVLLAGSHVCVRGGWVR